MINYTISYGNTNDSIIHITYELNDIKESVLFLQLPAWRPGRYELGNFAKNVFTISVKDKTGSEIPYKKIKKDKWRIECDGIDFIRVSYDYAAVIKNAGGTYKTKSSMVITPVNCLMYAESRIFEECHISIDVPEGFSLASSLEKTMCTENYFELGASPLVYSKNLHRKVVEENGVNFHVCFEGEVAPNWGEILPDFQRFIRFQLALFNDFESEDYYFLNLIFPEKHYHGVEHLHSTLIALGPDSEFEKQDFYRNLLGISSHELFHYWNICRLRPLEMSPYDYAKENYFETGYIAEGVTTYYGDFVLGASGVFTVKETLNELSGTVNRHLLNPARGRVSVAESSIDLWLDGYEKGVDGRKVSIYAKGATIAWILDLWILKTTKNQKSLDDVMLLFWTRFGKTRRGYITKNYQECIEDVVGESAQWYFDELVHGTQLLEDYLTPLLSHFGMNLELSNSSSTFFKRFGIEIEESNGVFIITGKSLGAQEASDLELGDIVITLSNEKMTSSLLDEVMIEEYLSVGVRRGERILSRSLSSGDYSSEKKWEISQLEKLTKKQQNNFNAWLLR